MAPAAEPSPEAAIFHAIRSGDQSRVESLLDTNPSAANATDAQGLSALTVATYYGQANIVDLLLARGAKDDIFAATARGDRQAVENLLRDFPDLINSYSSDGWSALALAAHFGRLEIAQILLDRGAEPNRVSQNLNTNTPLHAAVAGNQRESVVLLLQHGANVNATDAGGWTPLGLAAHEGRGPIIEILLAAGADPNKPNAQGDTPLMVARERDHQDAVALLLSGGAAPTA
ncbi:MAG: ankyrin repeat domain-containing protein [Thermomicrobiales bacterium]